MYLLNLNRNLNGFELLDKLKNFGELLRQVRIALIYRLSEKRVAANLQKL